MAMPNLPTSLILVLLALAWLVVLVPMFARSREAVPETDDSAAGFRVLRHAGARLRPTRRRRGDEEMTEDDMADDVDFDDNLVTELVDQDEEFDDDDDLGTSDTPPQRVLVRAGTAGSSPYHGGGGNGRLDGDDGAGTEYDDAPQTGGADRTSEEGRRAPTGSSRSQIDAADEWASEHQPVAVVSHARPAGSHPVGQQALAPPDRRSAHRAGRGGFDPAHDAAAAAYRFRRRRFVTLIFLLLTLGLTAGAVLFNPGLAIGAVVCGLVMIGYLFYLSRQVRIERAISERRMARLRRAREIRPAMVRQAAPRSPYQQPARPEQSGSRGPAERSAAGSSQVHPAQRPGYTMVDLDDDDPAFEDLEKFEPVVYRRAAGQ